MKEEIEQIYNSKVLFFDPKAARKNSKNIERAESLDVLESMQTH